MKANCIKLFFLILFLVSIVKGQKEQNNWYFGGHIGIDFGATPPSTNNLGQTNTIGGTASISDANGNLLFYTDGKTVYNKNHQIMSNGTGLFGSISAQQTALIINKPSSTNLYYIFTIGSLATEKYCYSIVDMSLAAGIGSVTVKNVPLWFPSTNSSRIISGTRHCNGIDYWIVCHELGNNIFRSYKLTSLGVDTNAVISAQGSNLCCIQGVLKMSPNGKKIALVNKPQTTNGEITINGFDNSTGAVLSNSIVLSGISKVPYGIEFSPNSNLFYGASGYGGSATSTVNNTVMQWNLCAGDNQAVNNSMLVLSSPVTTINTVSAGNGLMHLAPDGKIYIGRDSQFWMATIDYPDSIGSACNYNNESLFIHPLVCSPVTPNFITSSLRTSLLKMPTHTITCQDVSFNSLNSIQQLCSTGGYSLLNSYWNFGDPLSGGTNTTNIFNPSHHYSSAGTFTASFITIYQCFTDTIKQVIQIVNAAPDFTLSGKTSICKGETATLTANGAYTYSWSTNSTSSSVIVSPTLSTQYTVVATNTLNTCKTQKTYSLTVNKCLGLINYTENDKDLLVYPNPTDGNFIVETVETVNLFIYNKLGQLVYKSLGEKGKQTIDLTLFKDGIYLVKVFGIDFNKQMKIIKTSE